VDMTNFCEGMEKLGKRFKHLSQDALDIYYDRIKKIPNGPFITIVDNIIDREKFFPTPGVFLDQWRNLLPTVQTSRKEFPEAKCPYCKRGVIEAWVKDKTIGRYYLHAFRCGDCITGIDALARCVPRARWSDLKARKDVRMERPAIDNEMPAPVNDIPF
jgi:hypothetical protein